MSKKTAKSEARPGFRRYSARARVAAPYKPPIDRLGSWLSQRSRLVRTVIAASIALVLTAALVLLVYAYLLNVGPDSLSRYLGEHLELITIGLIIFTIIGLGFYWVGWRLLIGFDLSDETVEPGRGAALWVMFAFFVLITMLVMMIFTTIAALQE